MKRMFSGLMLTLLLMSILSLAVNIKPIKGSTAKGNVDVIIGAYYYVWWGMPLEFG